MSSRSEPFECHWRASRLLLALYLVALLLACMATLGAAAPVWLKAAALLGCLVHAVWILPRRILLGHAGAWRGLRHDEQGWQLWSRAHGWQPIQLRPDSLALPLVVILRFRLPGQRLVRGLCIPRDSLSRDRHRRLRVRLKFSRRRWAAPE